MDFHVSGKLRTETAKQPSFTSVRIEALFDRKAAPTPEAPSKSRATAIDIAAVLTETDLESAPDQIAAASATSTSAEAPIPFRVSAVSDDAGNFTLVFPGEHQIASETVKFRVSLPAGHP